MHGKIVFIYGWTNLSFLSWQGHKRTIHDHVQRTQKQRFTAQGNRYVNFPLENLLINCGAQKNCLKKSFPILSQDEALGMQRKQLNQKDSHYKAMTTWLG